jgi:hypothetical protein
MGATGTIGSASLVGAIREFGIGNDQLRDLVGTPMKTWLGLHGRTTALIVSASHEETELNLQLRDIRLVDNGNNDMFDIKAEVLDDDPDSETRWVEGYLLWEREGQDRGQFRISS